MSQITTAEFEQMLTEQSQYSTKKWTDLEINKVYSVVDFRLVDTVYGKPMILTLTDGAEVWAPGHLK